MENVCIWLRPCEETVWTFACSQKVKALHTLHNSDVWFISLYNRVRVTHTSSKYPPAGWWRYVGICEAGWRSGGGRVGPLCNQTTDICSLGFPLSSVLQLAFHVQWFPTLLYQVLLILLPPIIGFLVSVHIQMGIVHVNVFFFFIKTRLEYDSKTHNTTTACFHVIFALTLDVWVNWS